MRRYFITGGTGFLGRAIVRKLLLRRDTERIVCLTRGTRLDYIHHAKLTYLQGDITDVELPDENVRFTDLIHAAAEANDLLSPDQHRYYYTVVEGARRIFEWAADVGIFRSLFVSSGCVHKGDTAYCRGKRIAEWLCERAGIQAKIARVYSLVGEEMPINGQYAIGRFVHQALQGRVEYYGGGSIRSYLHVDDCANWLLAALDRGLSDRIYDVGGGHHTSVSDLAHLVARVFQVPIIEIESDDKRVNTYVPSAMSLSSTKIALGVNETVNLREALERVKSHLCHTDLQSRQAS